MAIYRGACWTLLLGLLAAGGWWGSWPLLVAAMIPLACLKLVKP